jgi:hypothetical protein
MARGDPRLSVPDLSLVSIPTSGPSCLIAMALKNSKTGSLPVSEIYSFMKEHFPYFKVRALVQGGALKPPRLSLASSAPHHILASQFYGQ